MPTHAILIPNAAAWIGRTAYNRVSPSSASDITADDAITAFQLDGAEDNEAFSGWGVKG